jgi:hypothetical protein
MRDAIHRKSSLICLACLLTWQIWTPASAAGSWYFVDTRIAADGAVTRELFQPQSSVPPAAQKSSTWESLQLVSPPNLLWASSTHDLNVPIPAIAESFGPPVENRPTYVVAWNTFGSAQLIPDHMQISAVPQFEGFPPPTDLKTSGLYRKTETTRYFFVTEYRWSETLTSSMELDLVPERLDELIELLGQLNRVVWQAALHPDYDATNYLKWYEESLLTTYRKEWEIFIEASSYTNARWPLEPEESWSDQLESRFLELELPLKKTYFGSAEPELEGRVVFGFLYPLFILPFPPLAVEADGSEPADDLTFSDWLDDWPAPAPIKRRDGEPLGEINMQALFRPDAAAALDTSIADRFGSKVAIMGRLNTLYGQLWADLGTDRISCWLACDRNLFRFSLALPGQIVTSNGLQTSPDKVVWRFEANDVYPGGRRMFARSLALDLDSQLASLGTLMVTTTEETIEFAELFARVSSYDEVRQSLAADSLSVKALDRIAYVYTRVVSPNAAKWNCLALEKGSADAAWRLAYMHAANGSAGYDAISGISRDDRAAFVWFAIAERRGYGGSASSDNVARKLDGLSQEAAAEALDMLEEWTPDQCPWPGPSVPDKP